MFRGIGRHAAKIIISPETDPFLIKARFRGMLCRVKYIDGIRDQGVVGPGIRCVGRPWQVLQEIVKGIEGPALKKDSHD